MIKKITKNISSFKKEEVKKIFSSAKSKIFVDGLKIFIAPKQSDLGRVLVITPRRVGNSPKRNLIRRRIKSIFYEEKLYEKQNDWIVFVGERKSTGLSFLRLKEIIINASQNKK
ncbi:hypothetical protein HN446_04675 [bacterium]|jgi:ribonuclease P protein component|nr:hypothetical protein [bacterium]